ncbi:MAG: hypothetical protein AB7O52_02765 [Planctomycetota bacterium]
MEWQRRSLGGVGVMLCALLSACSPGGSGGDPHREVSEHELTAIKELSSEVAATRSEVKEFTGKLRAGSKLDPAQSAAIEAAVLKMEARLEDISRRLDGVSPAEHEH